MAWSERWHTGRHGKALLRSFSRTHPTPNEWGEASFTEIVLFPMVPYLAWAVLYYAKVRSDASTSKAQLVIVMRKAGAHELCSC